MLYSWRCLWLNRLLDILLTIIQKIFSTFRCFNHFPPMSEMKHLPEIQTKLTVTETSVFNSNVDALALPQLWCIYGWCAELGYKSYTDILATSYGICFLIIESGKKTKLFCDPWWMPNCTFPKGLQWTYNENHLTKSFQRSSRAVKNK